MTFKGGILFPKKNAIPNEKMPAPNPLMITITKGSLEDIF